MTTLEVDDPTDAKVKQESDDDSDSEGDAVDKEVERKLEKKQLYDNERHKNMEITEEHGAKKREYDRKRRANFTAELRAKEEVKRRQDELRAKKQEEIKKRQEENEKLFLERQATALKQRRKRVEEVRANGEIPPKKPRDRNAARLRETPEQREKRLEGKRQARKRMLARMTEEERKEYRLRRYFQQKARQENMSKEEREGKLKKMAEYTKNYMKNLSPDKKEKYKAMQRESLRKQQKKMWKENPEKMLKYMRDRVAKETSEQRQVRLKRYKINAAKRKLKMQLEDEGVLSVEEIDKRCEELVDKMKSEPLPPLSSEYKPRPSGRKPKKMPARPPGRKPPNGGGRPRKDSSQGKASSEYTYTPDPSKRRLKNRGILYELEMQGKTAQENSQSGSTPVASTEKHRSISPRQQQNRRNNLAASTETRNGELERAVPETFDDCPSSPVGDDHFCPSDDDDSHASQQFENIPPPALELNCCPHCLVTFQNESDLSCHITIEHPWKCPHCSERVSNFSQLASHFKRKHSKGRRRFVCMRCPWRVGNFSKNSCFKKHRDLLDHVQRHHASSYWPCPTCNLLLYSEPRFNSHFALCAIALALKQAVAETPLLCGICGKSFATRKSYGDHMDQYHHPDIGKLVCPRCKKLCSHPKSFWHHFVTCSKLVPKQPRLTRQDEIQERKRLDRKQAEPMPCDQCGKTFAQKCTLDDHIRRDHQGESYMCPQCGKNFQSAGKLWRHQAEIHGLTDLPPPPGVEVMRCLYCQDFIMRGYEFHVKKKHPEHLKDFRANELPKVKEKLEQVKFKNPKRPYSNSVDVKGLEEVSLEHGRVGGEKGQRCRWREARKIKCPVCQLVISRGHLPRHMRTIHGTVPQEDKSIKCSICEKICANAELFRCHYALSHAFDGLDEKFLSKNLITKRRSAGLTENSRKMEAVCSICDVVLPNDKIAIRAHFLVRHYSQFLEIVESAGDADIRVASSAAAP